MFRLQDDGHLSIFWWLAGGWDSILLPSLIKIPFIFINLRSIHYSILRSEGSCWHWTTRTAGLLCVWAITMHNYRLNQAKLSHYIAMFYHPDPCICIIHHVKFLVCRPLWVCIEIIVSVDPSGYVFGMIISITYFKHMFLNFFSGLNWHITRYGGENVRQDP